jgi:hypothetical protein
VLAEKLTAYGVIMKALNTRFASNIFTLTMQANEKNFYGELDNNDPRYYG